MYDTSYRDEKFDLQNRSRFQHENYSNKVSFNDEVCTCDAKAMNSLACNTHSTKA